MLWAAQRECPPLLPSIGRELCLSIVAGWMESVPPMRQPDMHPQLQLGMFVIGSAAQFGETECFFSFIVLTRWRSSQMRAVWL